MTYMCKFLQYLDISLCQNFHTSKNTNSQFFKGMIKDLSVVCQFQESLSFKNILISVFLGDIFQGDHFGCL